MSPEHLIRSHLSLRFWTHRIVLPAALCLLAVLAAIAMVTDAEKTRDHQSVMVGFAALYFILVRGGHIIMIRSLHNELVEKHEAEYRAELAKLGEGRVRNLGFALAQIKRRIITAQNAFKRRR